MPMSDDPILSKRKISEEDDVEEKRCVKARHVVYHDRATSFEREEEKQAYSIPGLRFATESWAGIKRTNEDRHVDSVDFFPGPVFGIFDGHGGTFAADFLSRHLVKTVATMIRQYIGDKALAEFQWSQDQSKEETARKEALVEQATIVRQRRAEVEKLELESGIESSRDDLCNQLTDALVAIDHETMVIDSEEAARRKCRREWWNRHHRCFLKAFHDAFERVDGQILHKNPSQDGSTALLVWFLADSMDSDSELSLYTANVGDCRAVMCRGGQGVALTKDHKPNCPTERQRIERAGGFVSNVGGVFRVHTAAGAGLAVQSKEYSTYLAVSRAFGDRSLKVPTPLVSWEPQVERFCVEADDLFVILACDGIWDVLSAQAAVEIVFDHFDDAKAAADAIVKAAYKKGSEDNLTATVVVFGWKSEAVIRQGMMKARALNSQRKTLTTEQNDEEAEEEIDMFNL